MPHDPAAFLSETPVLAGRIIFFASYAVFALGKFPGLKIDRTGAAIIGAIAMVVFRVVPGEQAIRAVDFSTIVLLFAMMLVVGGLKLAGFFEWNAELVLRRLRPGMLLDFSPDRSRRHVEQGAADAHRQAIRRAC